MRKNLLSRRRGYVALLSVLVVSAAVTTVIVALPLLVVGESQVVLARWQAAQSRALVEGCADMVLLQLRESGTVPEAVVFPELTCSVTIAAQDDTQWDVQVSGNAEGIATTVRFSAERTSSVERTAWQLEE